MKYSLNPFLSVPGLMLVFLLVGSMLSPADEPTDMLVLYEFPGGQTAAFPSYPEDKAGYEAMDARWVAPEKEEHLYGFGGKASNAYLNNSAASRQFDPDTYLTITIQAEKGYVLNLHSLSFRFGASTLTSYEGGAFTVFTRVFSDAQAPDFSRELPIGIEKSGEMTFDVMAVPNPDPVYAEVEADLRGPEFQGRKSVTFRVHLYCSERSSRIFLRIDDIAVLGAVVRK